MVVKCLLSVCGDLSLVPQHPQKKPGLVVVYVALPQMSESEPDGAPGLAGKSVHLKK